MKSSLRVGSLEIGLSIPDSRLERLVALRYSAFLGAVERPAVLLDLVERAVDRTDVEVTATGDGWTISSPGVTGVLAGRRGKFELRPDIAATDQLLHVIVALLGPAHDTVLVQGVGVVAGGRAHVFFGPTATVLGVVGQMSMPILSVSTVALHPSDDGWVASWTPFFSSGYPQGGQAPLGVLWEVEAGTAGVLPLPRADGVRLILDNAVVPAISGQLVEQIFDAATRAAGACTVGRLDVESDEIVSHLAAHREALALRQQILGWSAPSFARRSIGGAR